VKIVRFVGSGLKWASLHFLASILIVPATLKAGALGSGITGLLTQLTKVLYFPILGLALYPRHWFPGLWIYVPIAINSMLWGLLLASIVLIAKRRRRTSQPGA
jgi:hypothetical protein